MKQVSKGWKGLNVTSRICGATLLAAFSATAFGHNNEPNPTDKPLVWVDSKGKTIGRAVGGVDIPGSNAVQVKVQGLSLIVPVGNELSNCGILGAGFPLGCDASLQVTWAVGSLVFEDSFCKGKAYVIGLFAGSDRAVGIYGKTLYIGDDNPTSKLIVPAPKAVLVNGVCDPNVPPAPFNTFHGWEVDKTKTVGLPTLGFKPPFYLK